MNLKNQIFGIFATAAVLTACGGPVINSSQVDNDDLYLIVGTGNPVGQPSILLYEFNQLTADFRLVSADSTVASPTFLCATPDEGILYAVSESDEASQAGMAAFRLDKEQGYLTRFSYQQNGAGAPCNISLSPKGDKLLCANYTGGSLTTFPLADDGSLQTPDLLQFQGSGPHKNQTQAHIHAVNFTPDDQYVILNDLGSDCLHIYPLLQREAHDTLPLFDVTRGYDLRLDAGAGPRHLCWSPKGKYAFVICELGGQIYTLRYENGRMEVVSSVLADEFQGEGSADIHITGDGRFLYASHRLKHDGISIWQVGEDGTLNGLGYQETGIHPRNFCLTPNERYLLVACRDSRAIQIYERDADTGMLSDTGKQIEVSRPMFVKFLGR